MSMDTSAQLKEGDLTDAFKHPQKYLVQEGESKNNREL